MWSRYYASTATYPLRLLDLSKAHPVPSDPLLVRGDVVLKVLLLHLGNAARARLPRPPNMRARAHDMPLASADRCNG